MDQSFLSPGATARIGPNAILQLVPVLDLVEGRTARDRLFGNAGVVVPPGDAGMWPEDLCRAAHQAVWQECGDRASLILSAAGLGTADYILANRIPAAVKTLIRALPGSLGARLLTAAISRHAWTFAGSGHFRVVSWRPLTFEIRDNPLAFGGHWHAAVFARLFQVLVWPAAQVEATVPGPDSRFTVHPH